MPLHDAPRADEGHGWSRDVQFQHRRRIRQAVLVLLHIAFLCTKDKCPSLLEALPARVLPSLCPSLLASHLSRSLAGLVQLSLCTALGLVVHFLAVSLLTMPVSRPQRSSSDPGGTATILVSSASLRLALFLALRSWLVQTRGFRTFERAPNDSVAEGRWRDARLWWFRWTKLEPPSEVVNLW